MHTVLQQLDKYIVIVNGYRQKQAALGADQVLLKACHVSMTKSLSLIPNKINGVWGKVLDSPLPIFLFITRSPQMKVDLFVLVFFNGAARPQPVLSSLRHVLTGSDVDD